MNPRQGRAAAAALHREAFIGARVRRTRLGVRDVLTGASAEPGEVAAVGQGRRAGYS